MVCANASGGDHTVWQCGRRRRRSGADQTTRVQRRFPTFWLDSPRRPQRDTPWKTCASGSAINGRQTGASILFKTYDLESDLKAGR